jgi:hypothetical protein
MRLFVGFALASSLLGAPLQIVRPILSDSDGGATLPANFQFRPGETVFFSCRVANFQKTEDEKMHLAYSVQALDAKGVPLVELYKNEISEEVHPQDKEWLPKIGTEIAIPPLIGAGTYTIVVKAQDLIAKSEAELRLPFEVHGLTPAPSDTLVIRNFQFFRSEDDTQPLAKAAYRAGDAVWTRFDITGFRYGAKNQIDVTYAVSILDSSGKVLWTQPEPTAAQSTSFYPKLWVPASMSIVVQPNTHPGVYSISVEVKDAIGDQTYEDKGQFTVE